MNRVHLFELEDQPWFPRVFRDAGTAYLEFAARVASRVGELEQQLARLDEWLHGALQELDAEQPALDESSSASAVADDEPVQPLERAFLGLFGPPEKP